MSKPYSCWGCDFHDPIGDYCFREEKDRHFVRVCDRVRGSLTVGNEELGMRAVEKIMLLFAAAVCVVATGFALWEAMLRW